MGQASEGFEVLVDEISFSRPVRLLRNFANGKLDLEAIVAKPARTLHLRLESRPG